MDSMLKDPYQQPTVSLLFTMPFLTPEYYEESLLSRQPMTIIELSSKIMCLIYNLATYRGFSKSHTNTRTFNHGSFRPFRWRSLAIISKQVDFRMKYEPGLKCGGHGEISKRTPAYKSLHSDSFEFDNLINPLKSGHAALETCFKSSRYSDLQNP